MKKFIILTLFLTLSLSLVSSQNIYDDCNIYGNCFEILNITTISVNLSGNFSWNESHANTIFLRLDTSNDPLTGDLKIEKANPIIEMKLTGEIQDIGLVFSEADGTTGGLFRYNGRGLFTDPKSFIFATFQTGGKIKFSTGGNLLALTLDENQNADFTGNIFIDSDSNSIGFGLNSPTPDATIGFDGNSLNIIANAVTSTDDLYIIADQMKLIDTDFVMDDTDTGRIIFGLAGPYDGTAFIGTGTEFGFGDTILGIRHRANILSHSTANGYPGFKGNIGGVIEIWNLDGAAYPLAIRQDRPDSAITVMMNPTTTGGRNADIIGLDFEFSTNSQPTFDVFEDQYIWGGIRTDVEYSGSMTFLRHNFYGGWFKSVSNNENVTAVGFRAIAENTADASNARAIIADGDVDINGNLNITGNITANEIQGGMWFDTIIPVTIPIDSVGVWVNVTTFNQTTNSGQILNGVDFINGNNPYLSPIISAFYDVYYSFSFGYSGGATREFEVAINVNGIIKNETKIQRSIGVNGDVGVVADGFPIFINASDIVTLQVRNIDGTEDVISHNSKVRLKYTLS